MIAGRNGGKAADTAAAISAETGGEVLGVSCDVTKETDIKTLVGETVAAFGGISTLVNNVGWGRAYEDPLDIPVEDMVESYRLNCLSAVRMTAGRRWRRPRSADPRLGNR